MMTSGQKQLLKFFQTYAPYISRTEHELIVEDHEAKFIANPEEAKYFIFGHEILKFFEGVYIPMNKQTSIQTIIDMNQKDTFPYRELIE